MVADNLVFKLLPVFKRSEQVGESFAKKLHHTGLRQLFKRIQHLWRKV